MPAPRGQEEEEQKEGEDEELEEQGSAQEEASRPDQLLERTHPAPGGKTLATRGPPPGDQRPPWTKHSAVASGRKEHCCFSTFLPTRIRSKSVPGAILAGSSSRTDL